MIKFNPMVIIQFILNLNYININSSSSKLNDCTAVFVPSEFNNILLNISVAMEAS